MPCASPTGFASLAPGDYVFVVRSVDAVGNASETRRAFTVTLPPPAAPAQIQPPPAPTVQTVVVEPAAGDGPDPAQGRQPVRAADRDHGHPVRLRGRRAQGPCDGSRRCPKAGARPETGDFYDGLFIVSTEAGEITELQA